MLGALNLNTFGASPPILNADHHINFPSTPTHIPLVAVPRVDCTTDSHFLTLSNSGGRVEIRANWYAYLVEFRVPYCALALYVLAREGH